MKELTQIVLLMPILNYGEQRDLGLANIDDERLNLFLSSIFYIVDLYNPDSEKEEYEFNDIELYSKISEELALYEAK